MLKISNLNAFLVFKNWRGSSVVHVVHMYIYIYYKLFWNEQIFVVVLIGCLSTPLLLTIWRLLLSFKTCFSNLLLLLFHLPLPLLLPLSLQSCSSRSTCLLYLFWLLLICSTMNYMLLLMMMLTMMIQQSTLCVLIECWGKVLRLIEGEG